MFGRRNRGIYADPPIGLSPGDEELARIAARDAARKARHRFTSARAQYREYRALAGSSYLDWRTWRAEYDKVYRRVGPHHGLSQSSDGGTAGSS